MKENLVVIMRELQNAGKSVGSDIATLTVAHLALIELELQSRLRRLLGIAVLLALLVVAASLALVMGSIVLALTLAGSFGLTNTEAVLVVALLNGVIVLMLRFFILRRVKGLSILNMESIRSVKESFRALLKETACQEQKVNS
jgi:uncharacterized membrane protein YqjE